MSWIDKMQQTKQAAIENPRLKIVFDSGNPTSEAFIASLRNHYPFLPDSYLSFLRNYDGAQIWMYVIFGSGKSKFPPIDRLAERWKPNLGNAAILPIGEDPSGDCLAITNDGRVVKMDFTMDSPAEAITIAASFEDLLNNVLMGHKYPSLFGGVLTPDHENEWTEYLQKKGWLMPS